MSAPIGRVRLDLDDSDIGAWIQRERTSGRVLTKPHLVESVVSGDPVTNCGRRLSRGTGYPFRVVALPSVLNQCWQCGPVFALPEDDGSTAPVDE